MFENKEIRTEIVDRTDKDYQNRVCPECKSKKRHRLNSYICEISDLGSIHVRKVLRFESVTFKCLNCGAHYLVEIEEAVKGHQYSQDVIEVAMKFMIDENL
ncbi:MAG: hypothetical protein GF329_17840, partial [Candidatus Lokiarchaeota archaeon]|nr:hypothetical protein [Candidatus Lokiarchaeota archaeon]